MEIMTSIHEIIDRAATDKPAIKPNELSELLVFNSMIIEKGDSVKKSIKFLTNNKNRKRIIDDIRYNERLADLYAQNNQKPKSIECLNEIIAINPSNESTYKALLSTMDLDIKNSDNLGKITDVIDTYLEKKPKINTPLLLLLKIMEPGEEFKTRLVLYMKPMILKGVDSLVNGIKWIYKNQ
jgi:tetratricopeptide (TPR) repeat protein